MNSLLNLSQGDCRIIFEAVEKVNIKGVSIQADCIGLSEEWQSSFGFVS